MLVESLFEQCLSGPRMIEVHFERVSSLYKMDCIENEIVGMINPLMMRVLLAMLKYFLLSDNGVILVSLVVRSLI